MVMELRKRKAPANPPPQPVKKSKTAGESKKRAATKVKEVKDAVAVPVKKAAAAAKKKAEKTEKAAVEKKDGAPAAVEPTPAEKASESAPAPASEPAPEPAVASGASASAPAPAKKPRGKAAAKEAAADAKAETKADSKAAATPKLKVGDTLPADLGEIQLDDGTKTTFGALLDSSEKGIVLFSYSKQGTPGCTSQACAMRDNYSAFTSAGYLVYGLSADSPADNAKFRAKQNLGYPLICDPGYPFHEKMGLKKTGPKAGTERSVVVVQKEGKVIKEHKSVTAKASLDVAKKAVGIDGVVAAPATKEDSKEKEAAGKKDESATKTVAVGAPAPEGEAAKPADS